MKLKLQVVRDSQELKESKRLPDRDIRRELWSTERRVEGSRDNLPSHQKN